MGLAWAKSALDLVQAACEEHKDIWVQIVGVFEVRRSLVYFLLIVRWSSYVVVALSCLDYAEIPQAQTAVC